MTPRRQDAKVFFLRALKNFAPVCRTISPTMPEETIDWREESAYGRSPKMLPCVRLWLWISAFASLAGWGLSAAGELNRKGYAVAFAVFIAGLAILWLKSRGKHPTSNIQHRTSKEAARIETTGCWMFNVGCFLLPIAPAFPGRARPPSGPGFPGPPALARRQPSR